MTRQLPGSALLVTADRLVDGRVADGERMRDASGVLEGQVAARRSGDAARREAVVLQLDDLYGRAGGAARRTFRAGA